MKYLLTVVITAALLLAFPACGQKDSKEDSPESAVSQTGGEGTNEISVTFSDQEEYTPGAFELKKTFAFISGMRYNAKSTAKLAYVVFANYEAVLGSYGVELPKEAGQIAIVVAFKTESKEIPFEQQMEEYAKMTVPTGTFEPSWMGDEKSFQVSYFVGGEGGGPGISGSGASGTATLTTSTPKKVSGAIDFTSPNGSTIKGTFNVKIEKDLWKS
ncbi:MAG: hypothetical protein JSV88_28960 [Candidatus Aminicenantes bacterium]|nr:MAG: hypothetical protein JSV88_28960 [Candidatus Aminicenantes bacterium]